ncbi:MAG: hypothetical protein ACRDQA_10990 [Nocardioidaceae bacterium]
MTEEVPGVGFVVDHNRPAGVVVVVQHHREPYAWAPAWLAQHPDAIVCWVEVAVVGEQVQRRRFICEPASEQQSSVSRSCRWSDTHLDPSSMSQPFTLTR